MLRPGCEPRWGAELPSRFMGIPPVLSHRGHAQEHSVLGLMLHVTILRLLIILSKKAVCKRSPRRQWSVCISRGDVHPSTCSVWEAAWLSIPVDPWWWELRETQHEYKVGCYVYDSVSGVLTALRAYITSIWTRCLLGILTTAAPMWDSDQEGSERALGTVPRKRETWEP